MWYLSLDILHQKWGDIAFLEVVMKYIELNHFLGQLQEIRVSVFKHYIVPMFLQHLLKTWNS